MIDAFLTDTLRKALAEKSIEQLTEDYGEPQIATVYSKGMGHWEPGSERPKAVAETPAEAQAMGRCAMARSMKGDLGALTDASIHPGECYFCGYPLDILLAACDHAVFISHHVDSEVAAWIFREGVRYERSTGRAGEYDNPKWANWWRGATPATIPANPSERAHLNRIRTDDVRRIAQWERVEVPV